MTQALNISASEQKAVDKMALHTKSLAEGATPAQGSHPPRVAARPGIEAIRERTAGYQVKRQAQGARTAPSGGVLAALDKIAQNTDEHRDDRQGGR